MKNCLIFSAFIPDQLAQRGVQYLNLISNYFSDCDVYIGLNQPFNLDIYKFAKSKFNCEIVDSDLVTNSDNSGYQKALKMLKESGKNYDLVYFSHTKSITHYHDYDMCIKYIEQEFYNNRKHIESIFNNDKIGGWSFYGDIDTRVVDDLDRFYKFPFKSYPVVYWLSSYVIRGNILDNFLNNCNEDFFNKRFEEFCFNRYFFEAYFPQIISKSGYIPFFDNHYNHASEKEKYSQIYDTIVKEGFKKNE